MAKDKVQIEETPFLELPEGSLLIKVQEKDGVKIETKAFRVVQGVIVIDMAYTDTTISGIKVSYMNGYRLEAETVNGKPTGTLVRVE